MRETIRQWLNPVYIGTVLIIFDCLLALAYWATGDYRRVVYWIAAAALTASITY